MEVPLQAWVRTAMRNIHRIRELTRILVDLGGSLAVASRGLYATGVSTDLNGMLMLNITSEAAKKPWLISLSRYSDIPELRRESR